MLKRAWKDEGEMLVYLQNIFHEAFVHFQSAVRLNNYRVNLDYLVYYKEGKFGVDVFYPKSTKSHYSNNIGAKYRAYKKFPFNVYLVVTNPEITSDLIIDNIKKSKAYRNSRAILITKNDFYNEIKNFHPLPNPYREVQITK